MSYSPKTPVPTTKNTTQAVPDPNNFPTLPVTLGVTFGLLLGLALGGGMGGVTGYYVHQVMMDRAFEAHRSALNNSAAKPLTPSPAFGGKDR